MNQVLKKSKGGQQFFHVLGTDEQTTWVQTLEAKTPEGAARANLSTYILGEDCGPAKIHIQVYDAVVSDRHYEGNTSSDEYDFARVLKDRGQMPAGEFDCRVGSDGIKVEASD